VTVTLPAEILQDIDRMETNRSRFVLDAVRHEIWASGLPDEDVTELVDVRAGKPVRWVPGEGWVEAAE
jgi:hypothetical protein